MGVIASRAGARTSQQLCVCVPTPRRPQDVAQSCETAEYFRVYHVAPRIEKFEAILEAAEAAEAEEAAAATAAAAPAPAAASPSKKGGSKAKKGAAAAAPSPAAPSPATTATATEHSLRSAEECSGEHVDEAQLLLEVTRCHRGVSVTRSHALASSAHPARLLRPARSLARSASTLPPRSSRSHRDETLTLSDGSDGQKKIAASIDHHLRDDVSKIEHDP